MYSWDGVALRLPGAVKVVLFHLGQNKRMPKWKYIDIVPEYQLSDLIVTIILNYYKNKYI